MLDFKTPFLTFLTAQTPMKTNSYIRALHTAVSLSIHRQLVGRDRLFVALRRQHVLHAHCCIDARLVPTLPGANHIKLLIRFGLERLPRILCCDPSLPSTGPRAP